MWIVCAEHYALTLPANGCGGLEAAVTRKRSEEVDEEAYRIWRLYMAGLITTVSHCGHT